MSARRALAAWLLAAASCAVAASGPNDFARQWQVLGYCGDGVRPVTVADAAPVRCEGAFAVALDESVYRQASRDDLSDVAAFNADGEVLAFGPMPAAYGPEPGRWRDAAWFVLPAPSAGTPSDLHLHVSRDSAGSLQLDATLSRAPSTSVSDLLVDVQAPDRAIEAIELVLALDAPDFSASVRVDASDDLQAWHPLVDAAAVAQLRQGGQALVRRHIELPATSARYLRLHVDGAPLPLRGLRLLLQPDAAAREPLRRSRIAADYVGRDGGAYLYRLPARVPVERLSVALADENAVADFSISARPAGSSDWRYVGQLTAFRLRGAGLALDNESMDVATTRWQEWRIEPNVALARVPALRLEYRPETWLLLTHGRGPYVVAAGSGSARRDDFPLQALVSRVRSRYGRDWRPAEAALGPMQTAGGEAALSAYDPAQRRTWILWGVLVLAAAAIIVMVWRLLGERQAP